MNLRVYMLFRRGQFWIWRGQARLSERLTFGQLFPEHCTEAVVVLGTKNFGDM